MRTSRSAYGLMTQELESRRWNTAPSCTSVTLDMVPSVPVIILSFDNDMISIKDDLWFGAKQELNGTKYQGRYTFQASFTVYIRQPVHIFNPMDQNFDFGAGEVLRGWKAVAVNPR